MATLPVETRFWQKVDIPDDPDSAWEDECWEWTANTSRGYGRFSGKFGESSRPAHRVAYELVIGPIPDGLVLDHLCRNPPCVNPAHLEPVTHEENCRRGVAADVARARQLAKTHCPQGHEYNEANTYVNPKGWRVCRACRSIHSASHARRQRKDRQ